MKNYIIINGVPSWEIPGLIICTLPPITKPPKKLSTLTIPGANGDIVTSIGGYDAYDRKWTVGVSRAVGDMEQIVQYLAQSGEIVYGNEPDKIYDMRQTARIDFNKLVRHYQAEVVQTVQPIKRSILPPTRFSFSASGYQSEGMQLTNDGNTDSYPLYRIEATTGDVELLIMTGATAWLVTISPTHQQYDTLQIDLDTATGNAYGSIEWTEGGQTQFYQGYMTDYVEVRNIAQDKVYDITYLRIPADGTGGLIQLYGTPQTIPTVTVYNTTAYI